MSVTILRHTFLQCRPSTWALLDNFRLRGWSCCVSTSAALQVGYQIRDNLTDCYNLLNVAEECTMDELKVYP